MGKRGQRKRAAAEARKRQKRAAAAARRKAAALAPVPDVPAPVAPTPVPDVQAPVASAPVPDAPVPDAPVADASTPVPVASVPVAVVPVPVVFAPVPDARVAAPSIPVPTISAGAAVAALRGVMRVELVVPAALLAIVVAAELVFLVGGLVASVVASLAALTVLLAAAVARRGQLVGAVAISLAVLPLLRVLSIAVPSLLVPTWLWYLQIGIPVMVATLAAAAIAGVSRTQLGLARAPVLPTLVAAGAGLVIGLAAFVISRPETILGDRSAATFVFASVSVVVGGAVTEELLFRGLLQDVAERVVAGWGVLMSTALSTLLYLGTGNLRYVLLMAAVSLALGLTVRRYRSLVPAVACHGMLIWSQVILWPAAGG